MLTCTSEAITSEPSITDALVVGTFSVRITELVVTDSTGRYAGKSVPSKTRFAHTLVVGTGSIRVTYLSVTDYSRRS